MTPIPAIAASMAHSAVFIFRRQVGRTGRLALRPLPGKTQDELPFRAANVTHVWATRSESVLGIPFFAKYSGLPTTMRRTLPTRVAIMLESGSVPIRTAMSMLSSDGLTALSDKDIRMLISGKAFQEIVHHRQNMKASEGNGCSNDQLAAGRCVFAGSQRFCSTDVVEDAFRRREIGCAGVGQ